MEKKKVLIADRESQFVLKTLDILIETYEVSVAYSKKEVLNKVRTEYPDLIILGYLKPRGDSFLVHKIIKENINTKHIPILVIEVKPEDRLQKGWKINEEEQMDAEGYFTRPVKPAILKDEVERIISISLKKNKELSIALKLAESILLNQIEDYKKKIYQMVGINRIRNL